MVGNNEIQPQKIVPDTKTRRKTQSKSRARSCVSPEDGELITLDADRVIGLLLMVPPSVTRDVPTAAHEPAVQTEPGRVGGPAHWAEQRAG